MTVEMDKLKTVCTEEKCVCIDVKSCEESV